MSNRQPIYNLEEIINYMIQQKASMREASERFNVNLTKLHREIKKYNGIYKNAIEKHLLENKIMSQKNCGNYRWHKNI